MTTSGNQLRYLARGGLRIALMVLLGAYLLREVIAARIGRAREDVFTIASLLDGSLFQHARLTLLLEPLARSCTIILIGIVIAGLSSLMLGYNLARRPHSRVWDFLASGATMVSSVPLLVAGIIAFALLSRWHASSPELPLWSSILAGGLLMACCDGILAEWLRSIRSVLYELQDKTYFLAHKARGQGTVGLAMRTLGPYLRDGLATRVSYLFGAVTVVEYALSCHGLGFLLFNHILNPTKEYGPQQAIVACMLIMAVPALTRLLLRMPLLQSTRATAGGRT